MSNKNGIEKTRRVFLGLLMKNAAGLVFLYFFTPGLAAAHIEAKKLGGRLQSKKYVKLLGELQTRHGFSKSEINKIFEKVQLHSRIPKLFAKPAEKKKLDEFLPSEFASSRNIREYRV